MILSARSIVLTSASALVLGLGSASARADDAGDKALAKVDAALNKATTLQAELNGVTTETGKPERKLGLRVWLKGDKRLVEYTAPADMKGTKVLVLSSTEVYAYLPAFGKVRRIATHTSDQGAFGMAFSVNDLASQRYGGSYGATVVVGTAAQTLTLTPKAGVTTPWAKIVMVASKDKSLPSELKYFTADGKHARTETRTGTTCEGAVCTPATLKMNDHARGLTTTLTRVSLKVNPPISDDVFTKRNLEK